MSAPEDGAPAFARDYPRVPELDALVRAFAAGDYAHVRAHAPELAAKTEDPRVRDAARELVDRTRADPLAKALLLVTLVLLVAMTAWWIAKDAPR